MNTLDELMDERFVLERRFHLLQMKSEHARLAEQEACADYESAAFRVREYLRLRGIDNLVINKKG